MTDEDQSKILRFSSETTSPTHDTSKKYQATAKYDRKALKKRLLLEEWMHYELRKLYGCKEDEEYQVEVDIDMLVEEEDDNKKMEMLKKLLHAAQGSTDIFITELLERVHQLDPNKSGKALSMKEMSI